jgi:hypothetical protein
MRAAMAMGMTVRQFLRCHSSQDIAELMAFDRLEPFGAGRTNMAIGELSALTANLSRDSKKWPEPFRSWQFVPFHRETDPPPAKRPAPKRAVAKKLRDHLKRRKA